MAPPLPVTWVPPHTPPGTNSSHWWREGCPTAGRSLPCLVDGGHWLPCGAGRGGGPGSPDSKLGWTELFPTHMGRPVSLPGWGLGTHGEPVSSHVPRTSASPGEPWRPPAPQGHVTPAWAHGRRAPHLSSYQELGQEGRSSMCRERPPLPGPCRGWGRACLSWALPGSWSLRTKVTHTCPSCPACPIPPGGPGGRHQARSKATASTMMPYHRIATHSGMAMCLG